MLNELLNNLDSKICILDTSLNVKHFNDGFIDMLQKVYGFKPNFNEHIFTNANTIFKKSWSTIIQNALNNNSFSEVVKIKQLGENNYFKISINPLIVNKCIEGVLVKVKDVTDETEVSLNLLAFKKLTENLPNTDVLLSDNKFNILLAGGGEMRKYGVDQDYYVGKNLIEEAIRLDLEILVNHYKKAKNGETASVEYSYGDFYYWLEVVPIIKNNNIQNYIVITRNITELKQINIKLNQVINTKDNILGIVAHDLRNPISAILGFNSLISRQSSDDIQYLDLINKSGNYALNIITDLLDFSELSNETNILETETTELNEFIRDIIETEKLNALHKSIVVSFESNRDDIFVNIHIEKFKRVITNLLSNAIKFSFNNGEIKLDVLHQGDSVTFSIADNGIGIPENLQEIIFDKFTKAGRKGTAGEKSFGLGMSIVKQIVNLHNGKIWLDSKENIGTKVFIQLKSAI